MEKEFNHGDIQNVEISTEMKKSYLRYKKKYDFTNLNLNALDKKSLMILWCLRSNAYLIIYLASKLRKG